MKKVLVYLLALLSLFAFVACKEEPEVVPAPAPAPVLDPADATADIYTNGGYVYVKFDIPQDVDTITMSYNIKDTIDNKDVMTFVAESLYNNFGEYLGFAEEVLDTKLFKAAFDEGRKFKDVDLYDEVYKYLQKNAAAKCDTGDAGVIAEYSVLKGSYLRADDFDGVLSLLNLGGDLFTLVAVPGTNNTTFRLAFEIPKYFENIVDYVLKAELLGSTGLEGGIVIPPIYITTDVLAVLGDVQNITGFGNYNYSQLFTSFSVYNVYGEMIGHKDFQKADLTDVKVEYHEGTVTITGLDEDVRYTFVNIDGIDIVPVTFTGVSEKTFAVEEDDKIMYVLIAKPNRGEAKHDEAFISFCGGYVEDEIAKAEEAAKVAEEAAKAAEEAAKAAATEAAEKAVTDASNLAIDAKNAAIKAKMDASNLAIDTNNATDAAVAKTAAGKAAESAKTAADEAAKAATRAAEAATAATTAGTDDAAKLAEEAAKAAEEAAKAAEEAAKVAEEAAKVAAKKVLKNELDSLAPVYAPGYITADAAGYYVMDFDEKEEITVREDRTYTIDLLKTEYVPNYSYVIGAKNAAKCFGIDVSDIAKEYKGFVAYAYIDDANDGYTGETKVAEYNSENPYANIKFASFEYTDAFITGKTITVYVEAKTEYDEVVSSEIYLKITNVPQLKIAPVYAKYWKAAYEENPAKGYYKMDFSYVENMEKVPGLDNAYFVDLSKLTYVGPEADAGEQNATMGFGFDIYDYLKSFEAVYGNKAEVYVDIDSAKGEIDGTEVSSYAKANRSPNIKFITAQYKSGETDEFEAGDIVTVTVDFTGSIYLADITFELHIINEPQGYVAKPEE